MIMPDRSARPQNALMRRMQRYITASTIFRSPEAEQTAANDTIQRATSSTVKASLLPSPSPLPMGRTVDASGVAPMPSTDVFQAGLPSEPMAPPPNVDPVTAAIDHVEQMQRSPQAQMPPSAPPTPTPSQTAQTIPTTVEPAPSTPPVVDPVSKTGDEDDFGGAWGRLQRIFKEHDAKNTQEGGSPTPPEIQRTASEETAVPPTHPSDAIQRAVDAAESATPKKAPLESIWPVKQTDTPAPESDEPVVMDLHDKPVSTDPIQPPAQEETIRRKLGDVTADKRTDSSIELHLPRRPRPAQIQAKQEPGDANKSFWDRLRKAEGKPETVQRTVDTEIGPLPADMWEMLGETPPSPPQETPISGGESTPTIQSKPDDSRGDDTPQTDETAVPSFLAEAASTAPQTSEAIQRAIAAAESTTEETQPDTPSTPSPIQRKEASQTTPPTVSDAVSSTPSPVEPSEQTTTEDITAVQDSQVDPMVQRVEDQPSEPVQETFTPETVGEDPESSSMTSTAETSTQPTIDDTGTSDKSDAIQRAIAAAETPPSVKDSESTSDPGFQPIQAKQTDTLDTKPPQQKMSVVMPEPISPQEKTTQPESIQRDLDEQSTTGETSTSQQTVDLNADTAPLPELPEMPQSEITKSETAVSPSTTPSEPTGATPDAIQRAIQAAESPPPAETTVDSQTAVPGTPAVQPSEKSSSTESPIAQRTTKQEAEAPVGLTDEATAHEPETAVPDIPATSKTSSDTSEAIQRTESEAGQPVPPEPSPATQDAVQRAISAAEAPPTEESFAQKTMSEPKPTADTMADSETAVSSEELTIPETPTPQIETSSDSPAPVQPKSVDSGEPASPDAIQRAISAAEAPSMPAAPDASQNEPKTVVSADSTPQIQRKDAKTQRDTEGTQMGKSETSVSTPKTSVPPTTTETAVQRAIQAAESPPVKTDFDAIPPTPSDPQTTMPATYASTAAPTIDISPQTTPTISRLPLEPTGTDPVLPMSREAQIQRAIAAAEMSPTARTIQRMQTGTQTAVAPPSSLVQEMMASDWHVQETAVDTPTITAAQSTHSLMRALGEAEASPKSESKSESNEDTYQWPDIKPTSTPSSSDTLQRATEDSEISSGDSATEMQEDEEQDDTETEVDIDKLANEVYSQLRRRLAIEWERGRGKR